MMMFDDADDVDWAKESIKMKLINVLLFYFEKICQNNTRIINVKLSRTYFQLTINFVQQVVSKMGQRTFFYCCLIPCYCKVASSKL